MADPHAVDWAVIRREWETSGKSDMALAEQFGFRSANTILRKRKQDGWTRTKAVERASQVARAVRGTAHEPRGHASAAPTPANPLPRGEGVGEGQSGGVCVQTDAHTHTQPQQIRASQAENRLGVCADEGGGAGRSAGGGPGKSVEPTAHRTVDELMDERDASSRQVAARLIRDLDMIRVQAVQRQLAMADKLYTTAERILRAVAVIYCEPDQHDGGAYLWALGSLKAVNADKDTVSTLTKSASSMLEVASEMERKALGMDTLPAKEDAPGVPSVGIRPEDVLTHLSQMSLEDWGNAARKATLMRPALLEGRAEPVGAR